MNFDGNYIKIGDVSNLSDLKKAVNSEDFKRRSLRDTMEGTCHYDTRVSVGMFDIVSDIEGYVDTEVFNKFYPLVEEAVLRVEAHYDYKFSSVKSLIAVNLLSGGNISVHKDNEDYLGNENKGLYGICHRIHIVVNTNDKVLFNIDGEYKHFEEGSIYELNNLKPHFVLNNGNTDRIHIVMDIIGIKDRYSLYKQPIPENFYEG